MCQIMYIKGFIYFEIYCNTLCTSEYYDNFKKFCPLHTVRLTVFLALETSTELVYSRIHFYCIYLHWRKSRLPTHTNQDPRANSETFCSQWGRKKILNQPAVALTTSSKGIVELNLPFINNAWLRTDNL